jgi:hypothetical protein
MDARANPFESGPKEAQAMFSILRGWATVDPEASLAGFRQQGFSTILQVDETLRNVLVEIFYELAIRDPKHALRLLEAEGLVNLGNPDPFGQEPNPGSPPGETTGLHNPHVMTGLFKGLRSKEDLESIVETWTSQVWKSPKTTKSLAAHLAHVESGSREYRQRPPELEVAIQAAVSLAAHDFDAAQSWLRDLTLGSDAVDQEQFEHFHQKWSLTRPEEAFARLKAGTHPEHQARYAGTVLSQLPSLGPELMAALDSDAMRYQAVREASGSLGLYSSDDPYPAPGQANRLPDFEANYAAILATLAAAKLPPDQEADLLKRIHWDFQSRVPAADAAARR